jgi:hypothetical protein
VDVGASISSPYQVINRENTNDAESLSSPLVNLWHCSASQTYIREQLHRFFNVPEGFQSSALEARIGCFLYGRNRKRRERSVSLASEFILLSFDRSRLSSLKIRVYPIPVEDSVPYTWVPVLVNASLICDQGVFAAAIVSRDHA